MAGRLGSLRGPAVRQTEWVDEAVCYAQPSDIFYPGDPHGGQPSDRPEDYRVAKSLCDRCPVRRPCLEYALATGEKWGMWGGLMPSERVSEKRRRARGSRQTCLEPSQAPDQAAASG